MIVVNIASTDRSKYIKWKSVSINNILTRQVDTCKFIVKNKLRDGTTYTPTAGSDVTITNSGTKIFGGIIVRIKDRTDAFANIFYEVECIDYTRLLDARLVTKDYEDMTVDAIIADIRDNYLTGTGISIDNVDCNTVISYISFRYHTVSQAIQVLADLTQFHWWIDYDKDVHFVATGIETAPVDVVDTTGVYDQDSLIIRKDNRQIKNTVIVRGGKYLGDTFTANYIADGTQNVFPLTYRYEADDFKVTVTGSEKTVVQEPTDVPETADVLWNNDSRLIRFTGAKIPNNGADIKVAGRRFLPVIVKNRDTAAIDTMSASEGGTGEHEHLIVDESIITKKAARDRAQAELLAYANTIKEGNFRTRTDGFKAGQEVRINSVNLSIDEKLIISKVKTTMYTPNEPIYDITLITKRTLGIIEFLQGLLNKGKLAIDINPGEIVDTVESVADMLTFAESIETSNSHNPLTDSLDLDETLTVQSIDYAIQFVLGPYMPTGTKRTFLISGSRVGPTI